MKFWMREYDCSVHQAVDNANFVTEWMAQIR